MSEVLSCKVHLKLKLAHIVQKKEDKIEAIYYPSHVAQQIEQLIVASVIYYTFIRGLENYKG